MIDITPYQQKLEWLREWIHKRIDGIPYFWIDIDAVPHIYTMERVVEIFNQTGVLFYNHNDVSGYNSIMPISFDEYCQYKQTNK